MATQAWSANNEPDRATAIWDRLLGCFGDSLLRKFGKTPPPEWVGAIGMLNDFQLERGLRRLVFSGKTQAPALPEFVRLCRAVGGDDFDEGKPTLPRLAREDSFKGDAWDEAANRFLLGHFVTQIAKKTRVFGKPASYELLRASDADLRQLGIDRHYLDAGPDLVANTKKFVDAKNKWTADMRDLAVNGEVPVETQKAVWHDYISRVQL